MSEAIQIATITISKDQRALRPWKVQHIAAKMRAEGYNPSYPVTLDALGVLVDGGHRIAAARSVGITEVPYVLKQEGVSRIRHAIRCNEDGTDTERHDVFDLAELCWQLAEDGWTGQGIADELGWDRTRVEQFRAVREKLHPLAWQLARWGVTRNAGFVTGGQPSIVTASVTIVTPWKESHLRALIQHLAYDGDRAMMRAQVKAVRAVIARGSEKDKRFGQTEKKVTAKWIGAVAKKLAWHTRLALHMRDTLVQRVPLRDRVDLLKSVYQNVYGNKPTDTNWDKFDRATTKLNEQALSVVLYHDDAFQRVPILVDGSVALVVTDPPYNVTDNEWDKIGTDEEFLDFTRRWLEMIRPKLAEDYHLFLFCDPQYQAGIEAVLLDGGWPLKSRIIWSNRSLPSGRQVADRFAQTWQMVFHCGSHSLNWSPEWSDERFDVQVYAAPNSNMHDGGYHPTPKPVALLEHFVRIGSKPTDTVLDLFAGGGATGAACISVRQRRCILIEKEEKFCSAIEGRFSIRREEQE